MPCGAARREWGARGPQESGFVILVAVMPAQREAMETIETKPASLPAAGGAACLMAGPP
jgi:hypothetical protein